MDDLFLSIGAADTMRPMSLDGLKRYRDAGIQQVVVRLPTASPERIDAALEDMGDNLVVPAQAL